MHGNETILETLQAGPRILEGLDMEMILRLESGGPIADRERVTDADLIEARAEAWWTSHPLRGFPNVAVEDPRIVLEPVPFREEDGVEGSLAGFILEVVDPGETVTRLPFGRSVLEHVAARAARRLLADGRLEGKDTYHYELRVAPSAEPDPGPVVHAGVRSLGPRRTVPIRYRSLSLPRLRAVAEPVAADGEELMPFVFYTKEALARAERIARRGEAFDPPVETGGILLGSLCCCPETGRVFTVVSDVLEATDADATTYSLLYTGETWARIQAVLRAKAKDPDPVIGSTRAVGQVHGHGWPPAEGKCEACDERATCNRSSAFLSADDLRWCRAVFSGQPWQVSQVFGQSARGEPTAAFFGQRGGTLVPRGYHVVDEASVDADRAMRKKEIEMVPKKKTPSPDLPPPKEATKLLLDGSVPDELRLQLMRSMVESGHPAANKILLSLLRAATAASAEEEYLAKSKELGEMLRQMAEGPLRQGVFLRLTETGPWGPRAEIRLADRSHAFCVVPEKDLAASLRRGDLVWLEAAGKAVLFREEGPVEVGEEARLERRIGERCVEVTVRDHERCVLHASEDLVAQIEADEAQPGCAVIVSTALETAFRALPPEDGLAHYRFLAREPVPDVTEQDIGDPPAAIATFEEHVRREMEEPEVGRLYGLRACLSMVLHGISGSGKTLALQACWNLMYRIMSEVTGVAVEDLPYRVVRVRPSMVLSRWFGASDQRVDRLFDEIEILASELFVGPDGREHRLPLLVLIEEMDALTRARGHDADGIYDRVQSTLLQRWDVTASRTLRDSPVVFASTTNIVRHVDVAALRRAGAYMERFGHLGRRGFASVLDKHLRDRPVVADDGVTPEEARRDLVGRLTASLYSPNGSDPGQVEILCANEANRIVKHRRDFMVGGLVDRAVQSALGTACREHRAGSPRPGLTAGHLERAFATQVRNVADQLDRRNVTDFLTLPDGLHVTDVRRIPQSSVLPFELERAG